MSYLVCDKCGGYYELQPNESPNDFMDKCECGGNLKYVQNLNNVDELKKTCPNCGSSIEGNEELCPNCGFRLKESSLSENQLIFGTIWILFNIGILTIMANFFGWVLVMGIVTSIFKPMPGVSIYSVIGLILFLSVLTIIPILSVIALIRRFKNKYLSMYEKENWNWVAISVAFLITMIVSIFGRGFVPNVGLVGSLIGGFIAGCIVGKNYIDGLMNGGIPAGIAGFIVFYLLTLLSGTLITGQAPLNMTISISLLFAIVLFIVFFITGSIGGTIGAAIRKKISS